MGNLGRGVRIRAESRSAEARCRACGTPSRRRHSSYLRRLADRSVAGQSVQVDLLVQRFFCDNAACRLRTFAEQVDGLTVRYGRRTVQLGDLLSQTGLVLGGRAGARFTVHLAAAVSPSTLLRLVRRLPLPKIGTVKVLGVDEFALRRGHVYGTILVDMETHRPVDVLPDRNSATFAAWLCAHPGVETVCRDRASAYSLGAQSAIPGVQEVADRWHILDNLVSALERAIRRHRSCLAEPEPEPSPPAQTQTTPVPEPANPAASESPKALRVRQWHAEIRALAARGVRYQDIAKSTGRDPATVKRYAEAATWEELIGPPRAGRRSILVGHRDYLVQRWREGCNDAAVLAEELRRRGFSGDRRTVRRFLNTLTDAVRQLPLPKAAPGIREVARWIIGLPENVSEFCQQQLKAICHRCPHIDQLRYLARVFAGMLRNRSGSRLDQWIDQAKASGIPELQTFAGGLLKDRDAVLAGLTLEWSSGAVEGAVTRIKLIKRAGYGRAGFGLLRRRILLSP
ncbi:ISL3 family transposase [Kitasatospora sp. NPDC056273]|uniref:ISL3 family transposase n=1 Tax=Kitasatospora sp. NPDC056273 TaxID=3345769 RepID=UPI0035E0F0E3